MTRKKVKKKNSILSKIISIVLIVAAIVIFSGVLRNLYKMFSLQQQAKVVEAELEEPGIIGAAMLPMADGK